MMTQFERVIAVNERGKPIGQDHYNAKLTDADVECIRTLHEQHGLSYQVLAVKFDVSKWAVGRICRYERRNQTPARFKKIIVQVEL